MARLGIDYGTTNTVVVSADRGRYPVVPHVTETAIGRVLRDFFPSLVAHDTETGRLLFGAEAERCLAQPGAAQRYVPFRSLKRLLRDYADGARFGAALIPGGLDVRDTLRQFASAVYESVRGSGVLPADDPLEAVLTWPANANGAQRHVTRAAFRDAGFKIVATLNEPSAAAIELADRLVHGNRAKARQLNRTVAVFDLGGGTFDSSVVRIENDQYTVLGAAGIENLGGDDFDEALARMFAEELRIDFDALAPFQRLLLLSHACREKERLSAGSVRNLALDAEEIGLSGGSCKVAAGAFEKRLVELVEPAVGKLASTIEAARRAADGKALDALYLVGGSSRLPLISKMVAERFPKIQLLTSDKPFSATAMGAAIRSVESMRLRDVLARHFGVIRLAEFGTREFFDPVFPAGTRLPSQDEPPVTAEVRYVPKHNIGHLRYLECSAVDETGMPSAGVRPWAEILFPYEPGVPVTAPLSPARITWREDLVEPIAETYTCDSDGIVAVRVSRADGQARTFEVCGT